MYWKVEASATQKSGASFSPWGLTCYHSVDLPFRRRIAARHDPPSFLPAPPACQSPVTSPHGRSPGCSSTPVFSLDRLIQVTKLMVLKKSAFIHTRFILTNVLYNKTNKGQTGCLTDEQVLTCSYNKLKITIYIFPSVLPLQFLMNLS